MTANTHTASRVRDKKFKNETIFGKRKNIQRERKVTCTAGRLCTAHGGHRGWVPVECHGLLKRGAVLGGHARPLLQVPGVRVLKQTHLLSQEVVQEAHPRLLPLVQPVEPVSDLHSQLV